MPACLGVYTRQSKQNDFFKVTSTVSVPVPVTRVAIALKLWD